MIMLFGLLSSESELDFRPESLALAVVCFRVEGQAPDHLVAFLQACFRCFDHFVDVC